MNNIIITWLVIISACYVSQAQQVHHISQAQSTYSLSPSLEILADSSLQLTYPAVKHKPFTPFNKLDKKTNRHYAHWGRITLQSQLPYDQHFVLYLGAANFCEAYIENGQTLTKEKTGRLVPLSQRKIKEGRNAPIPLMLPEKSDQRPITIYFRVQNIDNRSIDIVPVLYTQTAWQARFKKRNLIQGIFHAIIWTLIIYQLSLFILLKNKDQFYTPAYFLGMSAYQASVSGILPEFFIGEIPRLNEATWAICLTIYPAFLYLLVRSFLNTKQNFRKWDKVFSVLINVHFLITLLSLALIFTTFNLGLILLIIQPVYLISLPAITVFCIVAYRKKINGSFLFITGTLQISIFAAINIIQAVINNTSNNSSAVGLVGHVIQAILFTMALAQKMKVSEEERRLAQAQKLRLIAEQNTLLEEKVKNRTLELEDKNQEIQAQNEELLQQHDEIEAQRDAINQQNQQLSERNHLISQSIKAAQAIQQAILPHQEKLNKLLPQHFIIYKPKDVVSGDFYWLNAVEDTIFLATIDCTGHGVPGAFMSLIGNTLLDKIIRVYKILDPAEVLLRLHNEVFHTLRQQNNHNNYGMDMSLIALTKEEDHYKISFCGAKHSLYYIDQGAETSIIELKGDRRSIGGIQPEQVQFNTQTIVLPAGTMIYTSSDGLKDQNNVQRKKFGSKKLGNLLVQTANLPLEVQKQTITQALEQHMQDTNQRDDILLIGIRLG